MAERPRGPSTHHTCAGNLPSTRSPWCTGFPSWGLHSYWTQQTNPGEMNNSGQHLRSHFVGKEARGQGDYRESGLDFSFGR